MKILKHIIDGKPVEGTIKNTFNITDPSSGETISQINSADKSIVAKAIDTAYEKLTSWQQVPPAKRANLMFDFRQLLIKHQNELAELISQEHGKNLADAKGELGRGLEIIEFCTSIHSHLKSDFSADISKGIDSYNIRQPVGVCAGVTPFNFPAMVPMWMFPVAIACGNTFVLKPSEKTPSATLRITELFHQAGFPDGVLNTVIGDKEAVDEILENPKISAVSFVGSTAVGEYIYQKGTGHNKRVQALCGAKNHMVIMPDADLDQACNAALGAAFGSAGERCMAISVLVCVGDETADKLLEKLTPKVKAIKIGKYDDPEVEMGPVVSQPSKEKILNYIEQGIQQGASLLVDGREEKYRQGFFIGGCLFDKVTPNMSIYTDEIFGPVLSVVRVENYAEALALVNDHEYGNGGAIFTRDGDSARHFSSNVKVGMVGINVPIPVPVSMHSFGGWKRSLFGANAIHGMEGVRFYTRLKTITSRWPSSIRDQSEFNFSKGSEV